MSEPGNDKLKLQSLKNLLTRGALSTTESTSTDVASPPTMSRSFAVERIANGLIVSPGMPGIVRYCKDASEAAELVADEIRRVFGG